MPDRESPSFLLYPISYLHKITLIIYNIGFLKIPVGTEDTITIIPLQISLPIITLHYNKLLRYFFNFTWEMVKAKI